MHLILFYDIHLFSFCHFTGSLAACKIIIDIAGRQCVNDRDTQGRNALHLATIGGHGDVVNFLLDHSGM